MQCQPIQKDIKKKVISIILLYVSYKSITVKGKHFQTHFCIIINCYDNVRQNKASHRPREGAIITYNYPDINSTNYSVTDRIVSQHRMLGHSVNFV